MANSNSLENAYKSIKYLKEKSLEEMKKNYLTCSGLSSHSGISRNNLSASYIKQYPEWNNIRQEVDSFKKEFEKLKKVKLANPIINELQEKLDNSYKQNLELLLEIKELKFNSDLYVNRVNLLIEEKEGIAIKLKEYVNKYGLL